MPNLTTKFSFSKPLVNNAADSDLWGTQLNANWDNIDGLLSRQTSSKSSNFTVSATEFGYVFLVDTNGGNVTATLPAAAAVFNGFVIGFKKIDAANTMTLDGDGSETIDGATTYALTDDDAAIGLVCDGSNWQVISLTATEVQDASTTQKGIVELSTDAELQTGTDTSRAVTPSNIKAAIGFTKFAETAEQTLSTGGTSSVAHSLGATPLFCIPILVCKNANNGYGVGDELLAPCGASTTNRGGQAYWDSTTANYIVGSNNLFLVDSSGGQFQPTLSQWRVKFICFV